MEVNKMAKLFYQGHSSVRIVSSKGTVIYVDPYAGGGYTLKADLILVSHEHKDHNNVSIVPSTKDTIILRSKDMLIDGKYQTKVVKDIKITAVPACNSNHNINECVGFFNLCR